MRLWFLFAGNTAWAIMAFFNVYFTPSCYRGELPDVLCLTLLGSVIMSIANVHNLIKTSKIKIESRNG